MAKLTSKNCQWKSSFLIDLVTASENFSNWLFFGFVSFMTNRDFFLKCLENIACDDAICSHVDFKDDEGIFFKILILGVKGRGATAKEENQDFFINNLNSF